MACIRPSQILRRRAPLEKEGPQKQRKLKFVASRFGPYSVIRMQVSYVDLCCEIWA
jgi:hypothetical protein